MAGLEDIDSVVEQVVERWRREQELRFERPSLFVSGGAAGAAPFVGQSLVAGALDEQHRMLRVDQALVDYYRYSATREPVSERAMYSAGGTEMKISGQFDASELTADKREELLGFYRAQLRGEFVKWPLASDQVAVYVDGRARLVSSDYRWWMGGEWVYVGYAEAGEVSAEMRLGVLGTLMGVTGHAGDAELQGEFARELGRVLVGTYERVSGTLVKASGVVDKVAFCERGSAAWIDGGWVAPNGDSVEVGEGWIVCELKRGEVEAEMVAPVGAARRVRETWEEMLRRTGFATETADDGRQAVDYMERGNAQREMEGEYEHGWEGRLEVVRVGARWGFAERLVVEQPVRRTFGEWLLVAGNSRATDVIDGRLGVPWPVRNGGETSARRDYESLREFGVDVELFERSGTWWVVESATVEF